MKRPFGVTILLWLVLSLTAWGGLRLATAILWWNTLFEFAPRPGPLYIAISGGAWMLIGIALLWGLWQIKTWTRYALLGAGTGFTVWYWCERYLFYSARLNWPFALVMSITLLIVLSACVFIPSTKTFLSKREAND